MIIETEYYTQLVDIMQKTRGARFTAAHLLVVRERFGIATLAILTIFLITVSVISLVSPNIVGSEGVKFFGALSVIASVWILVISLFDYALGRGLLSHKLHQNAIRITKIMREMERELAGPDPDMTRLRKLAKRYEDENAETGVNHSPYDYQAHLYEREKALTGFQKVWFPIRKWAFSSLVFCASVPSNLLVIIVVGGATIWYLFVK